MANIGAPRKIAILRATARVGGNLLFAAATAMGLALPAHAQMRTLQASVATRYDDNVFRAPPSVRDTLPQHGADLVTLLDLNASIKKEIGAISTTVQGGLEQTLYADHPSYNALTYQFGGTASYEAGRGALNITGSHLHELVPFEDTISAQKILHNLTQASLDGSREFFGRVRLVGRVGYLRNDISGATLRGNGVELFSGSVGIGYFSPTGNSVTLEYSQSRSSGLTPSIILTASGPSEYRANYREYSVVSHIVYQLSGITSLKGNIGYTRHDDRSVLNSDISGLQADISLYWSPTPNLTIASSYRRGFASENRVFSDGVSVTSYSLSATETLFGRVNLGLGASRENRNFRYDLQAPDPSNFSREEKRTRANASISYNIFSKYTATLQYEYSKRTTMRLELPYTDNVIMFTISRSFNI